MLLVLRNHLAENNSNDILNVFKGIAGRGGYLSVYHTSNMIIKPFLFPA